MTRKKTSLAIVAGLSCALALSACGKKEPPKKDPAAQARAVSVVRLEPRAITGALSASGTLRPREEAAVAAEVAGFRVLRVNADVGDTVRAGQVLYRIHADYPSDLHFARHAVDRHCGISLGTAAQIPQVFVES